MIKILSGVIKRGVPWRVDGVARGFEKRNARQPLTVFRKRNVRRPLTVFGKRNVAGTRPFSENGPSDFLIFLALIENSGLKPLVRFQKMVLCRELTVF